MDFTEGHGVSKEQVAKVKEKPNAAVLNSTPHEVSVQNCRQDQAKVDDSTSAGVPSNIFGVHIGIQLLCMHHHILQ